jgi:hypothetical protein
MMRGFCNALFGCCVVLSMVAGALTGCGEQQETAAPPVSPSADATSVEIEFIEPTDEDYPLTTCVVTGESLTIMGDPIAIRYAGREVRFCCDSCVKEFKKDPEKYLAVLDDAGKGDTDHADADTADADADADAGHEGHDH